MLPNKCVRIFCWRSSSLTDINSSHNSDNLSVDHSSLKKGKMITHKRIKTALFQSWLLEGRECFSPSGATNPWALAVLTGSLAVAMM
uniref:Uncharacterized protein n=1 Tax=Ditylenchus dipsaci TaxID=166011 RepID=A0A915CME8_9BILA